MWKSSLFVVMSAFLLNDHLSSGDFMTCLKAIEQVPVEILEFPIDITYDIVELIKYRLCHFWYLTDLIVYFTDWCVVDEIKNTTEPITSCPSTVPYKKPMDCFEVLKNGNNMSGVYTIWPRNRVMRNRSIEVYCNMDIDGGGWTVLLNRGNFSTQENFSRNWNDYKIGFGDMAKDFWLGNDNMYAISNQKEYEIRFDLVTANGTKAFAVYETFRIEDEASMYKLHIENYTAGNVLVLSKSDAKSMGYQNNMKFSTIDVDNDNSKNRKSCAARCGGGWWYDKCVMVLLTGEYEPGFVSIKSMKWGTLMKEGLAAANMKLRPK